MTTISDLLNWVGYVAGGGALLYVALIFLAPTLVPVAGKWLEALTPLVSMFAKGITTVGNILYAGIKDILDNVNTIITVALLVLVSLLYSEIEYGSKKVCDCKQCIDNIRPDYKFVKRTPAEKEAYLARNGGTNGKPWWPF